MHHFGCLGQLLNLMNQNQILSITSHIGVPMSEITLKAIRSQGPGGQHVNKVSTAIQLFFDVPSSSLPESVKTRILQSGTQYLTTDGILTFKVDLHRSQVRNKAEAYDRLAKYIFQFTKKKKKRIPTRPSKASKEKRIKYKKRRSDIKRMRENPKL